MDIRKELAIWRDLTINDFLGGLNTDVDSELIENNELTKAENVVIRNKRLTRDTGFSKSTESHIQTGLITSTEIPNGDTPRLTIIASASTAGGSLRTYVVCDETVYTFRGGMYKYVPTARTNLNGAVLVGATTITVDDASSFADGDRIGLDVGDGGTNDMEFNTVNGAPVGNIITLSSALVNAWADNTLVVKALELNGTSTTSFTKPVSAVQIPWSLEVVFTNGVDPVQVIDPLGGTAALSEVAVLTGVPTKTACRTLAIYDSSLILGGVSDWATGVEKTHYERILYSAKGDITEWTNLEAGSTDLLDGVGRVLSLIKLGPYLIVYREKGITRFTIASSIVGSNRFDIDTTVTEVEISGTRCVLDLIDKHLVWGKDKPFFYTGGFSIEPLPTKISATLPKKVDDVWRVDRRCLVHIKKYNEVLFISFSSTTAQRLQLDTGVWVDRILDLGGVNSNDVGSSFTIVTTSDGKVLAYDEDVETDDGADITLTVETKDFSHPTFLIRHESLELSVRGGTVTVKYSIDKGANWITLGTATGTTTLVKTKLFREFTSRTIRFQFTSTDPVTISWMNMRYKYEFEW